MRAIRVRPLRLTRYPLPSTSDRSRRAPRLCLPVGRPAETGSRAREVRRARDDVAIEARVQFAHGATGGSANGAIPTDVRAHLRSMLLCPASLRHSRVSRETSVSGAAAVRRGIDHRSLWMAVRPACSGRKRVSNAEAQRTRRGARAIGKAIVILSADRGRAGRLLRRRSNRVTRRAVTAKAVV